jgi:hypothetical protein
MIDICRKAVRATVVLLPLLGISYVIFITNPGESNVSKLLFVYFNSVLQSTQVSMSPRAPAVIDIACLSKNNRANHWRRFIYHLLSTLDDSAPLARAACDRSFCVLDER